MSRNYRFTGLFVQAFAASAALSVISLMTPTSVRAQGQDSENPASWAAPERASHVSNPLPASADVVKRGQKLFHRDCEQCHGKTGHGDGPLGMSLVPRPAYLASEQVQSQSDGALFWKMTEGRGAMPQATLAAEEKWAVIDYIRTLGRNGSTARSRGGIK